MVLTSLSNFLPLILLINIQLMVQLGAISWAMDGTHKRHPEWRVNPSLSKRTDETKIRLSVGLVGDTGIGFILTSAQLAAFSLEANLKYRERTKQSNK
jgi:hypothetical protein